LFKDIVVNLSAGKSGKIVGDYAISIASRLEAHITGIAIAFDLISSWRADSLAFVWLDPGITPCCRSRR
jgi:hypothetical protein